MKNLDLGSRELRSVFLGLKKVTMVVGKVVFNVGKAILNIIMKILQNFPNTIGGALAGFILGLIFSQIPVIGWLFGPLVLPALTAMGGIIGFMADMSKKLSDVPLEAKIRAKVMDDISAMGLNF